MTDPKSISDAVKQLDSSREILVLIRDKVDHLIGDIALNGPLLEVAALLSEAIARQSAAIKLLTD